MANPIISSILTETCRILWAIAWQINTNTRLKIEGGGVGWNSKYAPKLISSEPTKTRQNPQAIVQFRGK